MLSACFPSREPPIPEAGTGAPSEPWCCGFIEFKVWRLGFALYGPWVLCLVLLVLKLSKPADQVTNFPSKSLTPNG